VKLTQGIHVMHLFYRINRVVWAQAGPSTAAARSRLEALCASYSHPSAPRISTFVNVGGKADLAFMLLAAELDQLAQMHREIEDAFPAGALEKVYSYLSVTELSEYMSSEEDHRKQLIEREKLVPDSPEFTARMEDARKKMAEYAHYRLHPELPDWDVMCFYPMNKRRAGADNWYSLDFEMRKKLMGGHARVGRKYAGRVSQLITGSTGLDDWEWGVTLVAQQLDPIKEIVYEMRFDEVSARYGEFGEFYVNIRCAPAAAWKHLRL